MMFHEAINSASQGTAFIKFLFFVKIFRKIFGLEDRLIGRLKSYICKSCHVTLAEKFCVTKG